MRFMLLVKADKNSEAGMLPSQELLTEMGKAEDFGTALTPELREQEERLRAQAATNATR